MGSETGGRTVPERLHLESMSGKWNKEYTMKLNCFWILAAVLSMGETAMSQGTVEDYNRAYSLRSLYGAQQVYYSGVNPVWIEDTGNFWYVRHTPQGDEYVRVDAARRKRSAL